MTKVYKVDTRSKHLWLLLNSKNDAKHVHCTRLINVSSAILKPPPAIWMSITLNQVKIFLVLSISYFQILAFYKSNHKLIYIFRICKRDYTWFCRDCDSANISKSVATWHFVRLMIWTLILRPSIIYNSVLNYCIICRAALTY